MRPLSFLAALGATFALTAGAGAGAATAAPEPSPSPVQATAETPRALGLDSRAARNTSGVTVVVGKPTKTLSTSAVNRAVPEQWSNESVALPPGNQGQVGSCVSWAVGYSGYGSLMTKQKIAGAPMAPMYIHSQVSGDKVRGTTVPTALNLTMRQGIARAEIYWQGPFDYATKPTQEQRVDAAQYKLSGYYRISPYDRNAKQYIKEAVAKGMPVILSMNVLDNFKKMDATTATDYSYYPRGPIYGGHAMEVIGYDEKGVRIQNSWGTAWGDKGRFNLTWDGLLRSGTLLDIEAMGDVVYRPNPAPAPAA